MRGLVKAFLFTSLVSCPLEESILVSLLFNFFLHENPVLICTEWTKEPVDSRKDYECKHIKLIGININRIN